MTAGVVVGVVAALTGPWFAYKAVEHGNPLAYSRPNPEQWRERGRPAAFWVGLSIDELFTRPYQPGIQKPPREPVLYAEWWGDYWRTYRVPSDLHETPDVLPSEHARPLVRQVWLGLWVSVAALAGGSWHLASRAFRRRGDDVLATLLLSLGLLAVSYAGFLWAITWPAAQQGQSRSWHVLNAVPVVAVAAGYAVERIARESIPPPAGSRARHVPRCSRRLRIPRPSSGLRLGHAAAYPR